MDFITEDQSENFAIVVIIISGLSLISLVFCLYCYFKFQVLQNQQFALVSKVIVGDVLYTVIEISIAVSYLIMKDRQDTLADYNYPLCQMQAVLSTYSVLFSVAWTSLICHALYSSVITNKQHSQTLDIFIGYILPAIIAFIPTFFNGYGVSYPWPQTNCFFNEELKFWEFDLFLTVFYYVPIWISFIYNIIVIIIVVRSLSKSLKKKGINSPKSIYQLFIYPGILAFCWVIVLYYYMQPGIVSQFNLTTLSWLYSSAIMSNSIGLLDSVCYCYTHIFCLLKFEKGRMIDPNELEIKTQNTELIQTKIGAI